MKKFAVLLTVVLACAIATPAFAAHKHHRKHHKKHHEAAQTQTQTPPPAPKH